ncbi:MAG: tetratricopeptide repeat protein [Verrucomicrobiae bacterium]|nr:tetratricopeptide repeat protein [Verrucomicrobiae bacterium]
MRDGEPLPIHPPAFRVQPPRLLRFARCLPPALAAAFLLLPLAASPAAPTPSSTLEHLLQGRYESAVNAATAALETDSRIEAWHALRIQSLLALGRYPEADAAMTNALAVHPRSVTLRWLARDAFSLNGRPDRAAEAVSEIPRLVSQRPWAYRETSDLVAVGRALLAGGVDPKDVLDRIYAVAKRAAPDHRDIYLASGELALEKQDFALAAQHFEEGLQRFPEDPDLLFGRARAFAPSDRQVMGAMIEAALKINPRHVPSLLLLADHRIDAEDYEASSQTLAEAHAVNPHHPEAWAYAAVIAHLRNDPAAEQAARNAATRHWPSNPAVPHLIGRKLSQKYRFAEGAALQQEALAFAPDFLPARAQLASDFLRLGEDAAGWDLIQQVHARDAYDVTAYNLVTLYDTLSQFRTLTNDHFIVRMSAHEADLYGPRVLDLLERARNHLAPKYGLTPTQPTIVEIFPDPKDFGVRTFGMPDNPGYLGVCFGRVITANSPASNRGRPVNWEAVLWHEYCHVVTLQLTANKMPRWLSEGISVYEERLANPAWGEQLNPRYREMLLGPDLTPVSRLSAAFLMPRSPLHLQFAYYQSSLVVEFLVERFGLPALLAILNDLRDGTFINVALESHTAPIETLERDFTGFAKSRAMTLGPDLDWTPPEDRRRPALANILEQATGGSRSNYWSLLEQARAQVENRQWDLAQPTLESLLSHYPNQKGPNSAHALLARLHRDQGDAAAERAALERWASVDGEAIDAYLRLMELARAESDWPAVEQNALRFLAVNPLVAPPYRHLARASEHLGNLPDAIGHYRTLLRLDPPNPGDVHFQLARLLEPSSPPAARRHALEALEEAPRHRAALQLLRRLGPSHAHTTPEPGMDPALRDRYGLGGTDPAARDRYGLVEPPDEPATPEAPPTDPTPPTP